MHCAARRATFRLASTRGGAFVATSRAYRQTGGVVTSACHVHCSRADKATLLTAQRLFSTSTVRCQSWSRNNMRRWMCVSEECHAVNPSSAQTCEKCGKDKPQLRGWKCVLCGTRNHSGVRKCKTCEAPSEQSNGFWMCAACGENNRVDEIEDNSRCGFCRYDMAPLSRSEEELLQSAQERQQRFTESQHAFDSISAQDAERNYGDELAGASQLPPSLSVPIGVRGLVTKAPGAFQPHSQPSRRSKIYRRHLAHDTATRGSHTGGNSSSTAPPGPPGFDWMCRDPECGQVNPGDEETCEKCGTHITPDDWECQECAALNHLSRSRCFSCDAAIPISWTCQECGGTTSIYDRECRRCHAQRPAVEPKAPKPRGSDAEDVPGGPGALRRRRGDWDCRSCNAHNFSRRTDCFQCGAARSDSSGDPTGAGGGGFGRAGANNNWQCPQCSADNFRTRQTCWQCKSPAPAWAAGMARSGSPTAPAHVQREGFQAGPLSAAARSPSEPVSRRASDWTCAKCYAKNYGRNADCFKCGAPKTVVTPARRTRARRPVKL